MGGETNTRRQITHETPTNSIIHKNVINESGLCILTVQRIPRKVAVLINDVYRNVNLMVAGTHDTRWQVKCFPNSLRTQLVLT